MLFFGMIVVATLAVAGLSWLRVPGLGTWTSRMRWGLSVALLIAGTDHVMTPQRYARMIESFLPFAHEIALITGLCEIAGAVGLLVPQTRRLAAILLAVYFVAVLPANINNALSGIRFEGLPTGDWYYWLRLVFQPLIIAWTLYAGGVLPRRQTG